MLKTWVARYRQHGDGGLSKKYSHYGAKFKLSVLRRMWREGLSYRQVAALFDLRGGHDVVVTWERKYHEGGLSALEPRPRGRPKTMPAPESPKPLAPEVEDTRTREEILEEVKYLRAEVAYLKKLRALRQEKEQAAQKRRG
jgi:transposase